MKCQNCGSHEATYHYRSNINGQVTEQHLCHECAQSMEGSMFAVASVNPIHELERSMFGESLGGGLGDSFFTDGLSLFNQMARSFFTEPALGAAVQAAEPAPVSSPEQRKVSIPAQACDELLQRRKINQLRREMKAAVRAENFERAAQLRDEIYQLEKQQDKD